jgi:hypothetical protein
VISPAYQEIHEHPVTGGIRVLLTGQSTPHHFSAVITAYAELEGFLIAFDVADRCRQPVEAIAATYLVRLGSSDLMDAGPGRVVWGGESLHHGRLEFEADDPATAALSEAGRRASRVQVLARLVPATATHRLGYRWRWIPGALP